MATLPLATPRLKNGFRRYGLAVALVLCALLLTLFVNPPQLASPIFLLAVIYVAWVGGTGPGLLAALLATMALAYFFLPPIHSFEFDPHELPQLVTFFIVAMVVSWWSAARRRAEDALLLTRDELEVRVSERTAELTEANESLQAEMTERERTEKALRDSDELWRAAFDSNPTMYFIVDRAGDILQVNPAGAEQLRYDVSELLGKPVLGIFVESDREAVRQHAEDCFAQLGETLRWEARKVRKDGEVIWVRETASAFALKNRPVLLVVCEDITERKRAADRLRKNETYLAEAQRLSHTGSFAYSPGSRKTLYWCEELFRIFRRDPQSGIPEFDETRRLVHPDDLERVSQECLQGFREKAEFSQTYRLLLHDGAVRHLHAVWHPVLDSAGELVEYVGTAADVTEPRQAEDERAAHVWFLESMDRINRAMQGTNDIERMMSDVLDAVLDIFACDRAWLVYPCDPEAPTWRAIMEHTVPQFPGAFSLGTDLPVDEEIASVFRAARASRGAAAFGPGCERELPARVAAGFSIRSMIAMAVYPKVEQPYVFGLHQCSCPRQWTAQEKRLFEEIGRRLADALTSLLAFRSLRESERKLDEAQRIAHVGYWEADFDRGGVTLSDEASRIYGLQTRALPHWRARLEFVHPEDRERVEEAHEVALQNGLHFEVEYRVVRANREVRMVHSRAHVTRDDAGRVRRIFGMVQDITELRRAEEALREAQAALARVNRVTTLGVLAASIAHEVNQPLGAMVTSAGSCSRWLAAEPPEFDKAQRALERIAKDGRRAGEVIERIRTLVQRLPPRRDRVELNDAILEVIALTRDLLRRSEVSLQTSLAQGLPPVNGDRIQLQQVIINLVVNAIEAMSAVGDRPRELAVCSALDGQNAARVEVRDSGPGVDADHAHKIFEAFHTTKAEGIGMGLSISRSIVEAHGGRLWAGPNEPHGAVFQFLLPIGEAGS
jgi:PAS domain S-box-containing protein